MKETFIDVNFRQSSLNHMVKPTSISIPCGFALSKTKSCLNILPPF